MDDELREFITTKMDGVSRDMARLSNVIENQAASIRMIELQTATQTTELRKDITSLNTEVAEVKAQIRSVDESQKFKWKEHAKEREEEATRKRKEEIELEKIKEKDSVNLEVRFKEVDLIKQKLSTLLNILWAIFLLVLSMVGTLVWQLVLNGGIKGLP